MTLMQVAIVVVACFLSMILIVNSCASSLEKRIDKYHRQELETINELKKSLENKDPHVELQMPAVVKSWQPWRYEDFKPSPYGTEDDILYPSHSEDKEGTNG